MFSRYLIENTVFSDAISNQNCVQPDIRGVQPLHAEAVHGGKSRILWFCMARDLVPGLPVLWEDGPRSHLPSTFLHSPGLLQHG